MSLPGPPPASEPFAGRHAGHASDPATLAEGILLSVDVAGAYVTISHGPLPNLGMPPMTMGFRIEPALLERIKPGDKVRFHVDAADGALLVTHIEVAK